MSQRLERIRFTFQPQRPWQQCLQTGYFSERCLFAPLPVVDVRVAHPPALVVKTSDPPPWCLVIPPASKPLRSAPPHALRLRTGRATFAALTGAFNGSDVRQGRTRLPAGSARLAEGKPDA